MPWLLLLMGCAVASCGDPTAGTVLTDAPPFADAAAGQSQPETQARPDDTPPNDTTRPTAETITREQPATNTNAYPALCLTRADSNPVDWVRFNLESHSVAGRLEVLGQTALIADKRPPRSPRCSTRLRKDAYWTLR